MKRLEHYELLIVGGGAAGMAACLAAEAAGCGSILLAERSEQLGGVLNQCLHNGFGTATFREDITGVEYARRFREKMAHSRATVLLDTMVTELTAERTALLSARGSFRRISFDRCVMAAGSRERTLYSLPVAGTRPAGVLTAGTAQRLVNLGGYDIGDNILILGTGDVGQIMARRLSLNGKRVLAMVESGASMGGLPRNRKQCVERYGIPVLLNSTVTRIYGQSRIEAVDVCSRVSGEVTNIRCDTLITAIGLIPERDLCRQVEGKADWLSFCGNCDYIHPIVDSVTSQALEVGAAAALPQQRKL